MFGKRCVKPTTKLIQTALIACLVSYWVPATRAAEDAPPWLRQAASMSAPPQGKGVPAITLVREQNVKVEEDGRVTTVERGAVRILTNEGRGEAGAAVPYRTDTGKVKDFRAWLITPAGEMKRYGKDEVVDIAAADNDVYNEVRVKAVSAEGNAQPGAVFGYEWTAEDRSVFTQFDWDFQDRLPTLVSRFTITLPQGWRAEGVTFNREKIEPVVSGSSYTWEARDLAFIDYEPDAPAVTNIAPRLAVSYFPAAGAKVGASFDNWAAVSRWLSQLSDSQYALDDALASKARQLTSEAKTELERIQAIGRFVQGINYVSIQTGVGRGGGYRPHAATEVFAKSYGDCKDKANLMRAMLRAINIPAYLVCIYSGDPSYVREEWPSPQQFNHCIIAVKLTDETIAASVVKHPSIGRLLIFDPTDDSTPVGDLPDHEQGSLALIIAGENGALMRMPVTPAEANRLDRDAEVTLNADGSVRAKLREISTGREAADERRAFRVLAKQDYVKAIERWITRGVNGALVSKVEPSDNMAEGRFTLDVEFSAARYAQLMQGRLLVFKPAMVSRQDSILLTSGSRRHAVVLEAKSFTETIRVKLPDGFLVDEMPDPVKLEAPFGSYSTAYEVKDGQLIFKRSMALSAVTIPANQFGIVRGFFEKIRSADQSPVVLMRK